MQCILPYFFCLKQPGSGTGWRQTSSAAGRPAAASKVAGKAALRAMGPTRSRPQARLWCRGYCKPGCVWPQYQLSAHKFMGRSDSQLHGLLHMRFPVGLLLSSGQERMAAVFRTAVSIWAFASGQHFVHFLRFRDDSGTFICKKAERA